MLYNIDYFKEPEEKDALTLNFPCIFIFLSVNPNNLLKSYQLLLLTLE
jgi:hypothetical protein